jgi:RHS repeat-associated protein
VPHVSLLSNKPALAGGDSEQLAGKLLEDLGFASQFPPGFGRPGYAPNGNILQHADSVMGTWNFTYDTLNRLATAQNTAATPVSQPQGFAGIGGSWTYDGFGNRKLEALSNANGNVQYTVTAPSANNQVSGFQYDAAGNATWDGQNQYLYDAEGRLRAVTNTIAGTTTISQYLYDAEGRRVGKGSLASWPSSCNAPTAANGFALTNQYLLDLSGDQATELGPSGNWMHSNVWTGGRLEATYDPYGLHFAISDPLGTKRVQATISATNGGGVPDLNCLCLPFGNNLGNGRVTDCVAPPGAAVAGQDATEHHFTGKERDQESGNDYFPARYYSSSMGRWLSPDWSAKAEPVPYATLEDPQSLNLYAYVRNNPLSHTDPDGHECTVDGEKHGGLWCLAHKLGFVQTQAEQVKDARFYADQYAKQHKGFDPSKLTDQQVLQAYKGGLFANDSSPDALNALYSNRTAVQAAFTIMSLFGSGGVDITRSGSRFTNTDTGVTQDQFGDALQAEGLKAGTASDGSIQYKGTLPNGDTVEVTMYPVRSSTGVPGGQVKINGQITEKLSFKP